MIITLSTVKSVMGTAALLLSSSLVIIILTSTIPSSLAHNNNLFSCDSSIPPTTGFNTCNFPTSTCNTFALLHTNPPHFSSLSNLASYLNLDRLSIAQANGLPPKTDSLPIDHQLLLIPLTCKCNSGVFAAQLVVETAVKGGTFSSISQSLQGLTTCNQIKTLNPNLDSTPNLAPILVPLKCACPEEPAKARIFLTYPVIPGDSLSTLSTRFNVSPESIVSANTHPLNLQPFTSILIPLNATKPPPFIIIRHRFRHPEMRRKVGIYIAVICGVIVGSIAIAAAFFLAIMLLKKNKNKKTKLPPQKQRKKQSISNKDADLELQQLSLSVRTTSDKKVSFESSQQDSLDVPATTPRKGMVILESYTVEELTRATEDFNSSNLIEGNVYHGRLNGKNMAIKRLNKTDLVSKIDFGILSIPTHHHHPKILRLLGTCLNEGESEKVPSYLVFEYAKNGSLRDWLLGGLAMKNQFIASCYCFLTWNQRLKICLDVAVGLQYMHLIMSPSYVHRNLRTRNIFLDEEFNAKIGNFAMAKLVEDDDCNDKSKDTGYLAPEYVKNAIVSPSVDIYAYGVVLMEVLSGKTAATDSGNAGKLHENIKGMLASEDAKELKDWMDSALGDNYPLDGAVALANLARTCVEEEPCSRPSAGDIVEKLSELVEELSVMGQGGAESNNMSLCESSCKPLVKNAAESMR